MMRKALFLLVALGAGFFAEGAYGIKSDPARIKAEEASLASFVPLNGSVFRMRQPDGETRLCVRDDENPDVLRGELGFDGIIITDSLGMGAVSGLHKARDLGVAAIQAGVDMLLMTPDLTASYQGVLDAVKAGTITEERIDESVTRIVRAKLAL